MARLAGVVVPGADATGQQDRRWASTRAHLAGKDDGLTALAAIRERFPRFADLLAAEPDADMFARLRAAESIGRPLGNDGFLAMIERATRRRLRPGKRGPKPSARPDEGQGELLNALSPQYRIVAATRGALLAFSPP
jgi:hypothetical protein